MNAAKFKEASATKTREAFVDGQLGNGEKECDGKVWALALNSVLENWAADADGPRMHISTANGSLPDVHTCVNGNESGTQQAYIAHAILRGEYNREGTMALLNQCAENGAPAP